MALAKTQGECARCGGIIPVGSKYLWSNLQKRRYHYAGDAACTSQRSDYTPPVDVIAGTTPDTPGAASAVLDVLAGALAERMTPQVPGIDADAVRAIVDRAIAERGPAIIEVRRPDAAPVTIEGAHFLLPRVIRLLGAGMHLYLWGPAGGGKTTAAMMAAHGLGRESEIDTLDPSTFRSMVQGYTTATTGEPVHTAFTRCWATDGGKVYVGDECDNAPGHVQTLFNSALANGHAPLAWGNVGRLPGFGFIGTGNTPGRPTSEFPDRRPMSAAFKDRLYFVYWPMDPAIECRAAGLPVPTPPRREERTCTPAEWGRFVQRLRAWAAVNTPTLMVTPRATLDGLRALAAGETPDEIADGLIFRGADAEMRRKALAAVSLPGA